MDKHQLQIYNKMKIKELSSIRAMNFKEVEKQESNFKIVLIVKFFKIK